MWTWSILSNGNRDNILIDINEQRFPELETDGEGKSVKRSFTSDEVVLYQEAKNEILNTITHLPLMMHSRMLHVSVSGNAKFYKATVVVS